MIVLSSCVDDCFEEKSNSETFEDKNERMNRRIRLMMNGKGYSSMCLVNFVWLIPVICLMNREGKIVEFDLLSF